MEHPTGRESPVIESNHDNPEVSLLHHTSYTANGIPSFMWTQLVQAKNDLFALDTLPDLFYIPLLARSTSIAQHQT
eukprot:jgi/Psemu1/49316/gm1.49316_g